VHELHSRPPSAVPADIRGLQYIHEKYGNLPWASVVTPAADVARHGFRVSEDLVRYMDIAKRITKRNFLVEDPSWALDFAPDGRLVQLGDIMYRKRYADTLDTIAREGPDAFYYGPIANSTIRAIQEADGIMMLEDLANYTVSVRPVVQIEYKGYRLSSVSAPASGAVALQMLKTMEGYNTTLEGESEELSTHQMVESMRFAYAAVCLALSSLWQSSDADNSQRSNLGDPGYVAGLQSYEHDMLKSENAARIRSRITDTSHNVAYYNPSGLEVLETPGTSHIVTADASGMALTLTTTVNLLFGSGIMVPETGIIINDEMNGESCLS
jgi:gamma-glutamyltranspeptidase/glutathione hydrolase